MGIGGLRKSHDATDGQDYVEEINDKDMNLGTMRIGTQATGQRNKLMHKRGASTDQGYNTIDATRGPLPIIK